MRWRRFTATLSEWGPVTRALSLDIRLKLLGLGIILALLPLQLGSYWTFIFAYVGLYIMLGMGLNVVVGFAGLLDLGYVAFFALGAYAYALVASPQFNLHLSFWLMLPVGMVLAAAAGVLLGIPVLRMRGDYLAIVTLGFGEMVRIVINNLDPITRGPKGIWNIDRPSIFDLDFTTSFHFYYLILIGCFVAAFFTHRLKNSRVGRAWEALREDEDAAAAMGVEPVRYKLLAFAIGASLGGLGGVIFAGNQGAIFPADFSLMVSINVLGLVIIGGMGSIPGVVVGAAILIGLPEVLRGLQEYRMLMFGALLVAVMIFRPEGFIPSARRKREFHPELEEEMRRAGGS